MKGDKYRYAPDAIRNFRANWDQTFRGKDKPESDKEKLPEMVENVMEHIKKGGKE